MCVCIDRQTDITNHQCEIDTDRNRAKSAVPTDYKHNQLIINRNVEEYWKIKQYKLNTLESVNLK